MRERVEPSLDDARVLAGQGEWTAALALIETQLQREPANIDALLLKAGVLLQSREEHAALTHYERASVLAPWSAEAHNGLARCLHAMHRNDEALARALLSLELLARPENFSQTGPVYLTLVWIHREMRRFKEALRAAEEGLARCPDAVLAQWGSVVEEEFEQAQQDRC